MDTIVFSVSEGMFKIFGLGFMAGGLFSFAVSLISDWISDRDERRSRLASRQQYQQHRKIAE